MIANESVRRADHVIAPPSTNLVVVKCDNAAWTNLDQCQFQVFPDSVVGVVAIDIDKIERSIVKAPHSVTGQRPVHFDPTLRDLFFEPIEDAPMHDIHVDATL